MNAYWDFVKSQYPDARFDFWYSIGELHFYPDGEAEAAGGSPYGCYKEDDKFVIETDF